MSATGWHKTDLASVVSALESGSRPKGGASVDTGAIASLGGENIVQTGGVVLSDVKRVPLTFFNRMTKGHLVDGDILINKDGAQTGKIGIYIGDGTGPACINEHLFLIRADDSRICQEFLYYTLLSEGGQRQISAQISGSAQPGLKSNFLKGIVTNIPDLLNEQAKIAQILSTVDRAIEQTEVIITKQRRIKTGLMQDLLTCGIDEHGNLRSPQTHAFKHSSLGSIPAEWQVTPAHELCTAVIDCKNRTPPVTSEGHPVIRTPNVRDGKFVFADLAFTDPTSYEIWVARGKPRPGDVVITREAPFGEVCQIPDDLLAPCLGQRMMMYQTNQKKMRPDYLVCAIQSMTVQTRLLELAGGSTVGHIRVGDIRKLPIPHPICIKEQASIAATMAASSAILENLQLQQQKLASVRSALMQDLLTGKRRVTTLLAAEPKRKRLYA